SVPPAPAHPKTHQTDSSSRGSSDPPHRKALMSKMARSWILAVLVCFVAVLPLTGAGTIVRPEEVGLSSERLQQVDALVKRHLDARSFSGAVTLVARNGRIAQLKAYGLADIDNKRPMQT